MRKLLLLFIGLLFWAGSSWGQKLSEGFENAAPVPPAEWIVYYANSSPAAGNLVTHTTDQHHEGLRSFRFSSYDRGDPYGQYLITPKLNVTSGDQTISFYYRNHNSYTETFRVGWSSTGNSITDFADSDWSEEISSYGETWNQYIKTDLPVGTKYVAIHYKSSYLYYLYIDQVEGPTLKVDPPISTFPYVQSFDDATFPPNGWVNNNTAGPGTPGIWDRQTTGTDPVCIPHSGSAMARYNCYSYATGTKGELITPPVNFPDDNYRVTFWMHRDGGFTARTDLVNVYYNTTNSSAGGTLLGTINRSRLKSPVVASEGWYFYKFNMPAGATGNGKYIIFEAVSADGDNIFLDDVTIEEIDPCPAPIALTATNITTTSAKLGWTETGDATAWDIKWDVSNFNPYIEGTFISGEGTNAYTLSGLTENGNYVWYVRAKCDNNYSSMWSGPFTFKTLCNAIELPYTEGFESMTTNFNCWSVMGNTAAQGGLNGNSLVPKTNYTWIVCTPTSFFGDNTYVHTGDRSAALNYNATDFNWLVSTDINMPATGNVDLKFWLWYKSGELGLTKFYVNVFADGIWNTILTYNTESQTTAFDSEIVASLDAFIGKTIKIAFVYEYNDGYELAVDDISIYVPTCPAPELLTVSDLTSGTANLGWTERGSASSWNIKWGVPGFDPASEGILISGVANPYILSSLNANTAYDWYVQAACSVGDKSFWAGPKTFTTLCEPASVPYLEKFDAPANSSCVTIQDLNGANTWKVTEGSGYTSHSLRNSIIYDYSSTTAADDWFFIQGLNLSVDKTYTLKFYYKASQGPLYKENLEVNYGTAPDATSMTSGILFEKIGIKSKFDDPFEVALVNFTPPSTGVYYIGFHCFSAADQASLYIDDISIDEIFCPAPEALTVSDLAFNSATLDWSQIGNATTAWNIKWGYPGFDPATEGTLISGVETKSYTLSDLVASTAYSCYVQAACGGVDQSYWTGPKTFTTLCNGSVPIPYFENFDAVTLPALPNCMSRIDANGDNITWVIDHFGYSAPNSALILRNPTKAMDDWLFTAGLQLVAGKTYELGYVYSLYSYIENLAVYWGSAPQVESMNQLVITSDQTLNNAGWRLASVTISPTVTGDYYIGFKGYSPADQFAITIDDIYVIEKVANATWSGAVDKNWYNAGNWANSAIPGSSTDVIIPAGVTRYPTIRSAANCNNITLKSSASGTASLLGNNRLIVNGTATVERYLPGASESWHLLSSPVFNQAISGDFIPSGSYDDLTGYDFYAWDEPTSIWLNQKVAVNGITDFVPGKGYLVAYQIPNTKSFTGNLNNGEVQFVLKHSETGNYNGSNLMGNPYPSGIDWTLAPKIQFVDNYAYAYNPLKSGGEGYDLIGGVSDVKNIGVGQGFMVLVKQIQANTLFEFTNAMRVHGGSFYKNTEAIDELKVRFANATNYDETSIRLSQESEFIRDRNDAVKMFSYNPAIPQVYTLTTDLVNASINAIPAINEEAVFPLCLYVPAEDTYVISLPVAEGEFAGRTVYLEDKLTGRVVNLSNSQTYAFAASPSDNTNRFVLKFSTLGIDKPTASDGVQVYAYGDVLYVAITSTEAVLVNVYNLTGQLVMQGKTGGDMLSTFNAAALSNGVYVVSVISNQGVVSQKVVIRK